MYGVGAVVGDGSGVDAAATAVVVSPKWVVNKAAAIIAPAAMAATIGRGFVLTCFLCPVRISIVLRPASRLALANHRDTTPAMRHRSAVLTRGTTSAASISSPAAHEARPPGFGRESRQHQRADDAR